MIRMILQIGIFFEISSIPNDRPQNTIYHMVCDQKTDQSSSPKLYKKQMSFSLDSHSFNSSSPFYLSLRLPLQPLTVFAQPIDLCDDNLLYIAPFGRKQLIMFFQINRGQFQNLWLMMRRFRSH